MSELPTIHNPFAQDNVIPVASHVNGDSAPETLEDLFNQEVNTAEAEEITKRNMAPGGTYVTSPEDWPPTISVAKRPDKDLKGVEAGTRRVATVIIRGTHTAKDGKETTQFLRFDLSPERRFKKIYENDQWIGMDEHKDDLASRLWANAVLCYESFHGSGVKYKESEVLEFFSHVPVAARTMQGNRGELVVLSLSPRGRRAR